MTWNDTIITNMEEHAAELVCAVRDRDAGRVAAVLDGLLRRERDALVILLAAAVPDDRPFAELLAWTTDPREWPEDHVRKLRRRYQKGIVTAETRAGEAEYRRRYNARRAEAAAA